MVNNFLDTLESVAGYLSDSDDIELESWDEFKKTYVDYTFTPLLSSEEDNCKISRNTIFNVFSSNSNLNKHVFISGNKGSGKSLLIEGLNQYSLEISKNKKEKNRSLVKINVFSHISYVEEECRKIKEHFSNVTDKQLILFSEIAFFSVLLHNLKKTCHKTLNISRPRDLSKKSQLTRKINKNLSKGKNCSDCDNLSALFSFKISKDSNSKINICLDDKCLRKLREQVVINLRDVNDYLNESCNFNSIYFCFDDMSLISNKNQKIVFNMICNLSNCNIFYFRYAIYLGKDFSYNPESFFTSYTATTVGVDSSFLTNTIFEVLDVHWKDRANGFQSFRKRSDEIGGKLLRKIIEKRIAYNSPGTTWDDCFKYIDGASESLYSLDKILYYASSGIPRIAGNILALAISEAKSDKISQIDIWKSSQRLYMNRFNNAHVVQFDFFIKDNYSSEGDINNQELYNLQQKVDNNKFLVRLNNEMKRMALLFDGNSPSSSYFNSSIIVCDQNLIGADGDRSISLSNINTEDQDIIYLLDLFCNIGFLMKRFVWGHEDDRNVFIRDNPPGSAYSINFGLISHLGMKWDDGTIDMSYEELCIESNKIMPLLNNIFLTTLQELKKTRLS